MTTGFGRGSAPTSRAEGKRNGADPDGSVGAGSESQASMRATLRPTLR